MFIAAPIIILLNQPRPVYAFFVHSIILCNLPRALQALGFATAVVIAFRGAFQPGSNSAAHRFHSIVHNNSDQNPPWQPSARAFLVQGMLRLYGTDIIAEDGLQIQTDFVHLPSVLKSLLPHWYACIAMYYKLFICVVLCCSS